MYIVELETEWWIQLVGVSLALAVSVEEEEEEVISGQQAFPKQSER
jgi:hypothetical protein